MTMFIFMEDKKGNDIGLEFSFPLGSLSFEKLKEAVEEKYPNAMFLGRYGIVTDEDGNTIGWIREVDKVIE